MFRIPQILNVSPFRTTPLPYVVLLKQYVGTFSTMSRTRKQNCKQSTGKGTLLEILDFVPDLGKCFPLGVFFP